MHQLCQTQLQFEVCIVTIIFSNYCRPCTSKSLGKHDCIVVRSHQHSLPWPPDHTLLQEHQSKPAHCNGVKDITLLSLLPLLEYPGIAHPPPAWAPLCTPGWPPHCTPCLAHPRTPSLAHLCTLSSPPPRSQVCTPGGRSC